MKKYLFIFFLLIIFILCSPVWAVQVPDLDAIGAAASDDIIYIIDVSDTTDRAEGTGKQGTVSNILTDTLIPADLTIQSTKDITAPSYTGAYVSGAGTIILTGSTVIGGTLSGTTIDDDNNTITNIDGENIKNDTIDDDSIDFSDVTAADLTLTDAGAIVTTSGTIDFTASDSFASGSHTIESGGHLRFYDDDNSAYVGFDSPSAVSSSKVWVLPGADGSANDRLTTDGSGNLTWADPGGQSGDVSYTSVTAAFVSGAATVDFSLATLSAPSMFTVGANTVEFATTDNYVMTYDDANNYWHGEAAGAGSGDLLANGTVPLTADWDVGAYTITAAGLVADTTVDFTGATVNIGTATAGGTLDMSANVLDNASQVNGIIISGTTGTFSGDVSGASFTGSFVSGANTVDFSSNTSFDAGSATVFFGVEDTSHGSMELYGGTGAVGSRIRMYSSVDEDGTEDWWQLEPGAEGGTTEFNLGIEGDLDLFKFYSAGNFTAGGNVAGATYASDASVSDAELKYINSLSSNAQTQITAKVSPNTDVAFTSVTGALVSGAATVDLQSATSINLGTDTVISGSGTISFAHEVIGNGFTLADGDSLIMGTSTFTATGRALTVDSTSVTFDGDGGAAILFAGSFSSDPCPSLGNPAIFLSNIGTICVCNDALTDLFLTGEACTYAP